VSQSRKERAWKIIAASALVFTLLLVLLPHPHHLVATAAYPVLAVVFLFAIVHVPGCLWVRSYASEEHPPQSPDLPSRFQRPPPATT
jgi:hypothetical protein